LDDTEHGGLPPSEPLIDLGFQAYPLEEALDEIFDNHGLERLGGTSGGLGWTSFAAYQRCPYLWRRLHIDTARAPSAIPSALEIGIAIHVHLAVHYQNLIGAFPFTSDWLHDALVDRGCNAGSLMEAWRVFQSYRLRYEEDYLTPLAVEHRVEDPVHGYSCRYDLVATIPDGVTDYMPGAYVVEHKSAGRFDDATLNGWHNDGEIIQQIHLWTRLHLDNVFGPLRGVIVNILGKQKPPQFQRRIVAPDLVVAESHARDLAVWQAHRRLAVATGVFPRARANCISRFGKCSEWDHCAVGGAR
jgi:hypothetical protein